MTAMLKISDGTTWVDLLNGPIRIKSWRPQIAQPKGGGVFSDSPIVDGRLLEHVSYENPTEAFELTIDAGSQDEAEVHKRNITTMLLKAESYWKSSAVSRPVFLEWKATNHTNIVYAPIVIGRWGNLANPYSQPYILPGGGAVEDGLTLTIERGHWMSEPPDSPVCLPAKVRTSFEYSDDVPYADRIMALNPICFWKLNDGSGSILSSYIDGAQDGAYIGSPAYMQQLFWTGDYCPYFFTGDVANIYSTAFNTAYLGSDNGKVGTTTMWVSGDGSAAWGTTDTTLFRVSTAGSNLIMATTTTTADRLRVTLLSDGGTNDIDYDFSEADHHNDSWFHLAIVRFGGPQNNQLIVYINGAQVGSTAISRPWTGSGPMNSNSCVIGAEDTTPGTSFMGRVAYPAFFDYELTQDEIKSLMYVPRQVGPAAAVMDEEACGDDTVYISNFFHPNGITHVYGDSDTGTNLVNAVGTQTMHSTAGNDTSYAYFGIATSVLDAGDGSGGLHHHYFTSLAFNLSSALDYVAGAWTEGWEYWNAAWVSLSTKSHSSDKDMFAEGPHIITFEPPSDWVTYNLGGGSPDIYWIRHAVDTSAVTPNVQSVTWDSPPYIVHKPYVHFRDDSPGDLDALATHMIRDINKDDDNIRCIIGRRSVSRGSGFSAYINLSRWDNQSNISVEEPSGTVPSFNFWPSARWIPSPYHIQFAPSGAMSDRSVATIKFHKPSDYYGRFRVFLRVRARDVDTYTYTVRLVMNEITDLTPTIQMLAALNDRYSVWDLGIVEIPGIRVSHTDQFDDLQMDIYMSASGGIGEQIDLYDLIMIPVDEWAIDVSTAQDTTYNRGVLKMDSAELVAAKSRVFELAYRDSSVRRARPFKGGAPVTAGTEEHKLWFLFITDEDALHRTADPFYYATYQGKKNKLYLTPRGSG